MRRRRRVKLPKVNSVAELDQLQSGLMPDSLQKDIYRSYICRVGDEHKEWRTHLLLLEPILIRLLDSSGKLSGSPLIGFDAEIIIKRVMNSEELPQLLEQARSERDAKREASETKTAS